MVTLASCPLAGEGPNITIYTLEPSTNQPVRCRKPVLRNYNVHGIKEQQNVAAGAKESTFLAVFGGKSFVVVELTFQGGTVKLSSRFPFCELHDWIWDLRWLEGSAETPSCVALALGHNSVVLYDCHGQGILQEVHCQEKCILYSALLVGASWDTLLLVAGTVFHQLVLWCMADPADDAGRIKPRSRISGHNGVIFSICFLESKSLLASASDDRSVRLWGVHNLRAAASHVQCLLVCYGHQSRVWSVRLLSDHIISIGEDSACLAWSYQGEIVHSFRGHKDRSLRAVAVHEERGWVFTGGADSGIRCWDLKGRRANGGSLMNLNFPSAQSRGSPRAVELLDANRLLMLTDTGALYVCDLSPRAWTFILEDAAYRSYGLLAVSGQGGAGTVCALGSLSGQVKVFALSSPAQSQELAVCEGKVHSLTWSCDPRQEPSTRALLASDSAGTLLWLEASHHPLGRVSVAVRRRFLLPPCKQRWHTCAAFLPQGEFLVCGDRRGSVMLFPSQPAPGLEKAPGSGAPSDSSLEAACTQPWLAAPDGGKEPRATEPVSLLFGLHGKPGVTSVTCHGGFIYSTGRDGCYRQLQLQGRQLQVLRKQKPCKGLEWLEELRFGPTGDMWVLGFHAARFVLWSASKGETLLSVPCGGGHRSWSYACCLSREAFAYLKSGDVVVYQRRGAPDEQRVVKESLHGRELTCLCHIGTLRTGRPGRVSVLATGSEDSMVNVLALGVKLHSVTQLTSLGDHISSVRALAVAADSTAPPEAGRISCVLFSAGGRAQIECYRLLLSLGHDSSGGVACQVIHLASHRLDERWDSMKNKHKLIKMDPETRYQQWPFPVADYPLAPWLSGACELFLLREHVQKLRLVAESFHHQRCVLKVVAFAHKTAGRRRHFLGSAATDGSISFWDITPTLLHIAEALKAGGTDVELLGRQLHGLPSPVLTVQAHSCGVNSLLVQETIDGHFLVASGGDDGSIALVVIDVTAEGISEQEATAGTGIRVLKKFSRHCAHAAHVTGVQFLPPDFLLSVSVDQRMTVWHLAEDRLTFVCSRFCHVADVAALECWEAEENSYCSVICGQGLERTVALSCWNAGV
uniref:tRNA (34-2'-O)-methyltransferase regulator WDR6 n=1 Tax=Varanus komodoensis TaxID=61221 RepID=A0A8D2LKC7_VARKO